MTLLTDPAGHVHGGDNDPEELAAAVKVFKGCCTWTTSAACTRPLARSPPTGCAATRSGCSWSARPQAAKTELVCSLAKLGDVHFAAVFTEAALLSGTAKKERAADATGGLLRQVGGRGIVVSKDFTSTLAQQRDTRAAALAALREVYDGHWSRPVGSDGGRVLHWSGKLGLVAGCTPAIDAHHAVLSSLGDRFVLYRLPATDAAKQGASALDRDDDDDMRVQLADAVEKLLAGVTLPDRPPRLTGDEKARMVALATLAARCRSAVPRDGYKQEIQFVPEAESPARLARTLWRLLEGMSALTVPRAEAWRVVTKVALDCMPSGRRAALRVLVAKSTELTTSDVADKVGQPTNTIRRALEDLTAHDVAVREQQGQGRADRWKLSDQAREWWLSALPDMSGTPSPGTVPDMSGGVEGDGRLLDPGPAADDHGKWTR